MTRNQIIKRTISKWADGIGIVSMASQQRLADRLIMALGSIERIPAWLDAEEAVKNGNPTPLEVFVYHNEPAGKQDIEFRNQLEELVNYLCGLTIRSADASPRK